MRRGVLSVLLVLGVVGQTTAQGRRQNLSTQAAGPILSFYDFGTDDPDITGNFRLDGLMPGVAFVMPGVMVCASRGTGAASIAGVPSDLTLTDISLRLRGDPGMLSRSIRANVTVGIPILILTTYRKVEAKQNSVTIDLFDYSTLGIGTGLAASAGGTNWKSEARITPAIGLATRSFGNSSGRFTAVEADLNLFLARLFGKYGLTMGYGWSTQKWHVGGSDALVVSTAGKVDYTGSSHTFRLGFAW